MKSDETDVSAIFFTSFFYLIVQESFVEVEIGRQRSLRPPVNLQRFGSGRQHRRIQRLKNLHYNIASTFV